MVAEKQKPLLALAVPAEKCELSKDVLRRVLRVFAQYGVFAETIDGKFDNTDLSNYMRSESSPLRDAILFSMTFRQMHDRDDGAD